MSFLTRYDGELREPLVTTEDEMAGWHHRLDGHEFDTFRQWTRLSDFTFFHFQAINQSDSLYPFEVVFQNTSPKVEFQS